MSEVIWQPIGGIRREAPPVPNIANSVVVTTAASALRAPGGAPFMARSAGPGRLQPNFLTPLYRRTEAGLRALACVGSTGASP